MAYYSDKPESTVRAFQTYKEFKTFLPVAASLGLDHKIDFSKQLLEEVQGKDPILVLIDVGGSIMCRVG